MKAKKYNLGGNIIDGVTGLAGGLLAAPFRALGANLSGGLSSNASDDKDGVIAKLLSEAQNKAKENAASGQMAKGGKVKASSASKRADGIAQRGKTRGRLV
jgi:hypothetical protein